jgi:hypothetical protein
VGWAGYAAGTVLVRAQVAMLPKRKERTLPQLFGCGMRRPSQDVSSERMHSTF